MYYPFMLSTPYTDYSLTDETFQLSKKFFNGVEVHIELYLAYHFA